MLYRSRNSGRDLWWNQLPCGPITRLLYKAQDPFSHADSPIGPNQGCLNPVPAIWMLDWSMLKVIPLKLFYYQTFFETWTD